MGYRENKLRAQTYTTQPSQTDQSQAKDTDLNIIVGQFLKNGTAPGNPRQPIPDADFTDMPTDLRGFIDQARNLEYHKRQLPKQLADLTTDQLMQLTPEQANTIMKPPPAKVEDKKDDPK